MIIIFYAYDELKARTAVVVVLHLLRGNFLNGRDEDDTGAFYVKQQ